MTRPAWAAVLEWEGWEPSTIIPHREMRRTTKSGQTIAIWQSSFDKRLYLIPCHGKYIPCDTPEGALEKANAIAAEFGGWAS